MDIPLRGCTRPRCAPSRWPTPAATRSIRRPAVMRQPRCGRRRASGRRCAQGAGSRVRRRRAGLLHVGGQLRQARREMTRMQYTISIAFSPLDQLIEIAKAAEELGFANIALPDSIFYFEKQSV